MAYQEGDTSPPHTNVHNDVRTQLDQLSTEFEIPVVLPPVVGLGDVGHVDHHNLFTTAIAELSKHECEDGLDGLGGWAEITDVGGSPKRYAYKDGGVDWVAFEWTADGEVKTSEGLADMLLVAGGTAAGKGWSPQPHGGGRVIPGLGKLDSDTHTVTIGKGSGTATNAATRAGGSTEIGPHKTGAHCSDLGAGYEVGVAGSDRWGVRSSITGVDESYGEGYNDYQPRAGKGDGGRALNYSATGTDGCAIIRVPAAQAAGVDPGSWVTRVDYYAEVTDGIVTDLYQEKFYGDDSVRTENGRYASPEQPDDLIPCDPSVAEGWTYADGEFTPPPPDPSWREQAIEALKQQIKDLQKDAK